MSEPLSYHTTQTRIVIYQSKLILGSSALTLFLIIIGTNSFHFYHFQYLVVLSYFFDPSFRLLLILSSHRSTRTTTTKNLHIYSQSSSFIFHLSFSCAFSGILLKILEL